MPVRPASKGSGALRSSIARSVLLAATALVIPSIAQATLWVSSPPPVIKGVEGYQSGNPYHYAVINNQGIAVSTNLEHDGIFIRAGAAIRWDVHGSPATRLEPLGTPSVAATVESFVYDINVLGTAVGKTDSYDSLGQFAGVNPVKWEKNTATPIKLGTLADNNGIQMGGRASAISDSGIIVGHLRTFKIVDNQVVAGGTLAARWNTGTTIPTVLDPLDISFEGDVDSGARAVNNSGTAIGIGSKYLAGTNSIRGSYPVRWDAGGTAITELETLVPDNFRDEQIHGETYAINDAGTTVGYSLKTDESGTFVGSRAVRWDAGSSLAIELGHLGVGSNGVTSIKATDINSVGTIIGWGSKHDGTENYLGRRAIRWDPGSTVAIELDSLDPNYGYAIAYDINESGAVAGSDYKPNPWIPGDYIESAVIWKPDGTVFDLNELNVMPAEGGGSWHLIDVTSLSDDGYVAGYGLFYPDSQNGQYVYPYPRDWAGQLGLGGDWLNTTNASNTWGKGKNWSTGTPAIQLDAVFNQDAAYTVNFDDHERARNLFIHQGDITFALNGRTLTIESEAYLAPGARLAANGTIVLTDPYFGQFYSEGTLAPGNSPGTLNVAGKLVSYGTIEFELASTLLYDQLNVEGEFIAGGLISVIYYGGFVPQVGDTFDLMDFLGLADSGYLLDLTQAPLGLGMNWDTSQFAATGTISVVPEPAGLALLALGAVPLLRRKSRAA